MGYVYLLLEVDKDGYERHKIGFSKDDPEKRKNKLQTGNSNIISVLNKFETDNYKKVEKWLHNKYFSQKTESDNEWFILTDEQVMSFIDDCKKINETVNYLLKNNPFYK